MEGSNPVRQSRLVSQNATPTGENATKVVPSRWQRERSPNSGLRVASEYPTERLSRVPRPGALEGGWCDFRQPMFLMRPFLNRISVSITCSMECHDRVGGCRRDQRIDTESTQIFELAADSSARY